MISKLTTRELKVLQSLKLKKFRQKYGLFVVEGEKLVNELLHSPFQLIYIVATQEKLDSKNKPDSSLLVKEISESDYSKFSTHPTPPGLAALFEFPQFEFPDNEIKKTTIFLDDIRDPGNLGTIIRIADWYGINEIYCSENTVDCFNPKVLSATMGSIGRVRVYYTSFQRFSEKCIIPKIGMVMDGTPLHKQVLPAQAAIIIGSESHGISAEHQSCCETLLTIQKTGEAESLNAGIAAAIVCDRMVNR